MQSAVFGRLQKNVKLGIGANSACLYVRIEGIIEADRTAQVLDIRYSVVSSLVSTEFAYVHWLLDCGFAIAAGE